MLDVSWNGLYMDGTIRIAVALTKNQSLRDIDLSCNRLSEACITEFLKGLAKNTTLTKLRVSCICTYLYKVPFTHCVVGRKQSLFAID